VQGVGGAFLSPATLTIIVTTFTGPRTARALGVWSAVAGAGGAVGSLLGGVLTAEISWRWVLFVNIPIGALAMAAAAAYLSESRRHEADRARGGLDIAGAITVTAGLGALIYAIVGTDTHPWGSAQTLSFLGAAAVLLAAFGVIETKVSSTPLVPFRLFRSRSLTGANLVMLLVGGAFFAFWYFLSLYMQNVLGYGPLKAGLAFFPMAVAIIIGAQVSSRLIARIGVRPLLMAGTLVAGGGFAWLSTISASSGYLDHVVGPGSMVSLALGLLFTPLASAATSGVHYTEAGLASGVLNTARQIGGSLGLAILATVATDRTHSVLRVHGRVPVALSDGYARAFVVATGVAAVAFAGSFIVPTIRTRTPSAPASEAVAAGDQGTVPTLDPA
jgi:MFS family permease